MGNSLSPADQKRFMTAIHQKDAELVRQMIQAGPLNALQTVYTSITYPTITIDLVSPLHLVAASSKDEVFDILLENNFPPFSNSLGETPLHIAACRRDNYKVTRLVNKYPQLLDYRNAYNQTVQEIYDSSKAPPGPPISIPLSPPNSNLMNWQDSVINSRRDESPGVIFRRQEVRDHILMLHIGPLADDPNLLVPNFLSHEFLAFSYVPELEDPLESGVPFRRIFTLDLAQVVMEPKLAKVIFSGPAKGLRSALRHDSKHYGIHKVAVLHNLSIEDIALVSKVVFARFGPYDALSNNCQTYARAVFQSLLTLKGTDEHVSNLKEIIRELQISETMPEDFALKLVSRVHYSPCGNSADHLPDSSSTSNSASASTSTTAAPISSVSSAFAGYAPSLALDDALVPEPLDLRTVAVEKKVKVIRINDRTVAELFDPTRVRDKVYIARRRVEGALPDILSVMYITQAGGQTVSRIFNVQLEREDAEGTPSLAFTGPHQGNHDALNIVEAVTLRDLSFGHIKFVASVLFTRDATVPHFDEISPAFTSDLFSALRQIYAFRTPLLKPDLFSDIYNAYTDAELASTLRSVMPPAPIIPSSSLLPTSSSLL